MNNNDVGKDDSQGERSLMQCWKHTPLCKKAWNKTKTVPIDYLTLMHKTWIRRIKIRLTTRKWPNIIQYLPECNSIFALIFALRLNTLTANHHIFASPTIQLRYQSFGIQLDDESRSGTPLCRNLMETTLTERDKKLKRKKYHVRWMTLEDTDKWQLSK